MSNRNMNILKTMCLTWTDSEIQEAWSLIAQEGKRRKKENTSRIKEDLQVGDTVTFEGGKNFGRCTGKVVRVKYKKAIIEVAGQNWDVPIAMLNKA